LGLAVVLKLLLAAGGDISKSVTSGPNHGASDVWAAAFRDQFQYMPLLSSVRLIQWFIGPCARIYIIVVSGGSSSYFIMITVQPRNLVLANDSCLDQIVLPLSAASVCCEWPPRVLPGAGRSRKQTSL
jgi:hypothetical protein